MAKPVIGTCHICGKQRKLSFEHVPPRAAFNGRRILQAKFMEVFQSESLDKVKGRIEQRGAGAYTLCEKCNNDTGTWYGDAYVDWACQAMAIMIGTGGHLSLMYPFKLFPLKVLKQIVCMFFSANSPAFQTKHTDLVRFVLNRESRYFPSDIQVYAFYTLPYRSRSSGVTGLLRGIDNTSMHVFSEVTFPPFGFVMTFENSRPPNDNLCEISSFSQFEYQDWRPNISMKLPVMPIYTVFPGDYRTREQTLSEMQRPASTVVCD